MYAWCTVEIDGWMLVGQQPCPMSIRIRRWLLAWNGWRVPVFFALSIPLQLLFIYGCDVLRRKHYDTQYCKIDCVCVWRCSAIFFLSIFIWFDFISSCHRPLESHCLRKTKNRASFPIFMRERYDCSRYRYRTHPLRASRTHIEWRHVAIWFTCAFNTFRWCVVWCGGAAESAKD